MFGLKLRPLCRYRKHVSACKAAYRHTAHMEVQEDAVKAEERKVSPQQAERLMPEGKVSKSGSLLFLILSLLHPLSLCRLTSEGSS